MGDAGSNAGLPRKGRVVPMKVICAGLPRTGTKSLHAAMERLGFTKTYHMITSIAVTDFPCTLFVPELVKAYPDAKVVLNTRDIDKWHTSVMNTIETVHRSMRSEQGRKKHAEILISDPVKGEMYNFHQKMWACAWDGDFEKNWRRKFHEHHETIRQVVPAENLLEYTVQEGWAPLCEFLGVPVPDEPFPRLNDTAELLAKHSFIEDEEVGKSEAS